MPKKIISVFIPCYNEEGNIPQIYDQITAVFEQKLSDYDYEIVFSDNKSLDQSRTILRKLAAADHRVKVILNTRNFGPGRSGAYGFFQTSGDATICMACDLQDPPELIPQFVEYWEQGYPIVLGRNPDSVESGIMKAFRNLYYNILKVTSAHDEYDHISGFGLYDKRVVDLLRAENSPYPNFRQSITEFGFEAAFIDYVKPARVAGKSSYSLSSYFDTAVLSVVTTSSAPLLFAMKIAIAASLLFGTLMLVALIVAIVQMSLLWLVITLIFLLCLGLSLVALLVAFAGMYSALTLDWSKRLPLVIEEERINFD